MGSPETTLHHPHGPLQVYLPTRDINIQSGSHNTGPEANINHGFATTGILSDIIKLVSIKQIQFNTLLNVHHIPGEKNIKADDLSRGRLSTFPESMRVLFQLGDIFGATPFPRYIINPQVQWDLDIHPLEKLCYCCFFPSMVVSFLLILCTLLCCLFL